VRHGQEHGKARARDGRIGGDRGEIERDQSAPQAVAGCLPRKEIATLTVAEGTGTIFIKRVVFGRRKNNDVSKRRASERREKYENYEYLTQSDYLRWQTDLQQGRKAPILLRRIISISGMVGTPRCGVRERTNRNENDENSGSLVQRCGRRSAPSLP
jgi:hypothetical protein